MPSREDLKYFQAMPLDIKVAMTKTRIREWAKEYGTDGVYVSFSGGKDSTVLLHIARQMYPNIKAVFGIGNGWTVDVIVHILKGLK